MRVVVVLAIASILLVAVAAEDPSMQPASAQKYEKKTHKHEKHDKEYKDKPDGYKPDSYKPDSYKPDSYKPDSYKPDSYKPDGYRPDGYKEYKYGKDYKPEYNGYEPEGYYGEGYTYERRPYDPRGEYDYNPLNGYNGQPSPYDGGYWGGSNGRQIIHLQAVYAENLLNTSLINNRESERIGPGQRCSEDNRGPCDMDFGLFCALRHHESEAYGGNDYSSGKFGPIFKTAPTQPVAIGRGRANYEPIFRRFGLFDEERAIDDLVIFNGHQVGYTWANVNGFIRFEDGAQACHPLLGQNTRVRFYDERVPVYLIIGKVRLPVDPAIALPFGGFDRTDTDTLTRKAQAEVQGGKDKDNEYKSTPEGNKYKVDDTHAYVLNEKDNTLCGLSIVARGAVSLTVNPPGNGVTDATTYTGTMEWPIMWSDMITTLPLLLSDRFVRNRQAGARQNENQGDIEVGPYQPFPYFAGFVGDQWLEKTIDRYAALCKANSDIPWIAPGSFTLDVSRVRTN